MLNKINSHLTSNAQHCTTRMYKMQLGLKNVKCLTILKKNEVFLGDTKEENMDSWILILFYLLSNLTY